MKKVLGYILGTGLLALSLTACGGSNTTGSASTACLAGQTQTVQGCLSQGACPSGELQTASGSCQLASSLQTTGSSCSVAGQISTVQFGCVTPTGGSCTVPGSATQGILYNGTCAQVNTYAGGSTGQIIQQCQGGLYATDGSNSCLVQNYSCSLQLGNRFAGLSATGQCEIGNTRPTCINNTYLQPMGNGQFACLSYQQQYGNGYGYGNNGLNGYGNNGLNGLGGNGGLYGNGGYSPGYGGNPNIQCHTWGPFYSCVYSTGGF